MQLPRKLRTASFRLAALHLGLSVASVAIVALVVLWDVQKSLEDQIRGRLMEATQALTAQHRANGLDRLVEVIRTETAIVGGLDFRLETPEGRRLAGTLPALPRDPGWATLRIAQGSLGGEESGQALAYVTFLPDGHLLAVAEEMTGTTKARRAVLEAFLAAMLIVVALGVVGGLVLNAVFLRRVQLMAEAARGVMAGDLSRRIPVKGAADEFGWLATVFNHMLDRTAGLIELNRSIGSALAHDLRSPLTRLLHRLETAQRRAASLAEHERAVEGAIADVNGILDTFNAILRIAQVEAGTRRADFRRLDIGEVVRSVAEAYAPVAQDEAKEIVTRTEPELWADGDRELLTQLVVNLVENAINHTPQGVAISVGARAADGLVIIEVADDGPGIAAEDRSRVLERFVRLDRARSTPGSGLGLTLCTAIAELHDATLRLEDAGPGLRCSVALPRRAAQGV